jgi:hypothetical protein
VTEYFFGTLADGLSPEIIALVFGVWLGWAIWKDPHANSGADCDE